MCVYVYIYIYTYDHLPPRFSLGMAGTNMMAQRTRLLEMSCSSHYPNSGQAEIHMESEADIDRWV